MKYYKIQSLLLGLTIIFYQLFNTQSYLKENIQYLPLILLFVFNLINIKVINIKQKKIIFPVVCYIFLPIVTFKIGSTDIFREILTMCLYMLFIINLYFISSSIKTKQQLHSLIKTQLFYNAVFLLPYIFAHFNEFNISSALATIMLEAREQRAFYGFMHPNLVAMFLFILFILLGIGQSEKIFSKKFSFFAMTLLVILIGSTGSRTPIICIWSYFFLEAIRFVLQKSSKNIRIILFQIVIIFMLIGLGTLFFYIHSIYDLDILLSGRVTHLLNNFNYLQSMSAQWFGLAPINISSLQMYFSIETIDNWYFVTMFTYGVIGLSIMLVYFTTQIILLVKKREFHYFIILILFLLYGTMENVLFIPGVLLSLVINIVILSVFNISKEKGDLIAD